MAEEHVQRRLAAIMATDVVGYSRLMSADDDQPPPSGPGSLLEDGGSLV